MATPDRLAPVDLLGEASRGTAPGEVACCGASALAQRVRELAGEAAGDGIALTLRDPWPPFSFRPDLPRPPLPAEA